MFLQPSSMNVIKDNGHLVSFIMVMAILAQSTFVSAGPETADDSILERDFAASCSGSEKCVLDPGVDVVVGGQNQGTAVAVGNSLLQNGRGVQRSTLEEFTNTSEPTVAQAGTDAPAPAQKLDEASTLQALSFSRHALASFAKLLFKRPPPSNSSLADLLQLSTREPSTGLFLFLASVLVVGVCICGMLLYAVLDAQDPDLQPSRPQLQSREARIPSPNLKQSQPSTQREAIRRVTGGTCSSAAQTAMMAKAAQPAMMAKNPSPARSPVPVFARESSLREPAPSPFLHHVSPVPISSHRLAPAPGGMDQALQGDALCPELVVPQLTECTLMLPYAPAGFSPSSADGISRVTVSDARGNPVMSMSREGELARSGSSELPVLKLAGEGCIDFLATAHHDKQSSSYVILDRSNTRFGVIKLNSVYVGGCVFHLETVHGKQVVFRSESTEGTMSVLSSDARLLAIVEPGTNHRTLIVGPTTDAGLVSLGMFCIDTLVQADHAKR